MHLRQPGFTNRVGGPFTKSKKEYKHLQEQEICDTIIKVN